MLQLHVYITNFRDHHKGLPSKSLATTHQRNLQIYQESVKEVELNVLKREMKYKHLSHDFYIRRKVQNKNAN